jgi:hypothetical protein
MPPINSSVESRLAEVEEELSRLKKILDSKTTNGDLPWWKQIIGTHENDPVFKKIVELGRKIRKGPKRRRVKSRRSTKVAQ